MIRELRDKKVVFFDVGYTLCAPATGDWMFTKAFLAAAGDRLALCGTDQVRSAREAGMRLLEREPYVPSVEAEIELFSAYYAFLSDDLDLGLTREAAASVARDRALRMDNYVPFPGIREVMETLSRTHLIGVISDTWPSIEGQLKYLGADPFLSYRTFSCFVGAFKPDPCMFLDALGQCGVPAEETVFLDDVPRNLEAAAELGMTPVLMAVRPGEAPDTPYRTVRDLRELIREED